MEENYIEKYKSIISDIAKMESSDHNGTPWYSENYHCPAYDKLRAAFPNLTFSKEDLFKLSSCSEKKEQNDSILYDLADFKYGHSFYESHGHTKTKEERATYAEAQANKESIDEQYTKTFTSFFHICESLNDIDANASVDGLETSIFDQLYEHNFELRPQNQILSNYYETYKKYRQEKDNNSIISQSNQTLTQKMDTTQAENNQLYQENALLKEKNKSLQHMLSKALDLCNHVKTSKFGKFFFRKQIKSLPIPDDIDIDSEEK